MSTNPAAVQERVRIEAEALLEEGRHAPEHVPSMFHYSPQMALIVMEYLAPPHVMLRTGLIAGELYPQLGVHMASFLARTLFHTSLYALDTAQHRCGFSLARFSAAVTALSLRIPPPQRPTLVDCGVI